MVYDKSFDQGTREFWLEEISQYS